MFTDVTHALAAAGFVQDNLCYN